jgi:drug/metabolite transporter (DMT)-like permease
MGESLIGPYIAFAGLCLIYGSSYAWISTFLTNTPPAVFSFLRMLFALITTLLIFCYQYNLTPGFRDKVKQQLNDGSVSGIKCFFGGIIGLGIPTSIITLAQRTVPSVIVTLSQPSIPLFSLVLAHFIVDGERMTFHKVFVHLTAFIGALLTIIPSLGLDSAEVSFRLVGFVFLFIGLFFYGLGSIYIKLYMTKGETALICSFSVCGGTAYNLLAILISGGLTGISALSLGLMLKIFVFSIFFSALPSFLFIYVVREIGPVKANLVDFGQIIIGVICGVFILDEWKNHKPSDKFICWIGVLQIFLALSFDFSGAWKAMGAEAPAVRRDEQKLLETGFATTE